MGIVAKTPNNASRVRMLVWFAIMTCSVLVQSLTLRTSPTIWQDEVQLTESGRVTIFEPHSSWSVVWNPSSDAPLRRLTYPGMALLELAYRTTHSFLGPRVVSLLGGVVCAALMIPLLRAFGVRDSMALALSIAFFHDPVVVSSYRNGRVDMWATAASLGAVILLRMRPASPRHRTLLTGASGALAALTVWLWPSAVLLIPFVLTCLLWRPPERGSRRISQDLAFFLAGGLIASLFLSLPVVRLVPTFAHELLYVYQSQKHPHPLSYRLLSFQLSPVLMLLFFCALFRRVNRVLMVTTWALIALICVTNAYSYRFLYLYPMFFVLVGSLLQESRRTIAWAACALLLVWSCCISLGWRSYCALTTADARDPGLITRAAQNLLGPGSYRVMAPYEFYYAGRALEWQMFLPWVDDPVENVPGHVQYAIYGAPGPAEDAFRAYKLIPVRTYSSGQNPVEGAWVRRFRIGGPTYASAYTLYKVVDALRP